MYVGPATSTVNDLVLPQMRATVSAVYLMLLTFIGMAMGPYIMGTISANLMADGMAGGPAIRSGILWGYSMLAVAVVVLLMACRTIKYDHVRIKTIAANYQRENP